jgi:hypothetical protein
MEIDELMILADNQIDYNTLSTENLKELVLGDELFIATFALGELANRNSKLAAEVAWKILSKSKGDHYLQAAALETVFQSNRELALDYMSRHAQEGNYYILNTIMELMIENKNDFQSGMPLSVSCLVYEQIKKLNDEEDFIEPEVKNRFLNLYTQVKNVQC